MRVIMGVLRHKNSGIYYARKTIPVRLQVAVAKVLKSSKSKQTFLKASLGTRDAGEANVRAKPALMRFDRILSAAEQLISTRPQRSELTAVEINRMAEYHYVSMLAADEQERAFGTVEWADGQDAVLEGFDLGGETPTSVFTREALELAQEALAASDASYVANEVSEVLDAFQVSLIPTSKAQRQLALNILQAHVRALADISQRNIGRPVSTPVLVSPVAEQPSDGRSLSAALKGWAKAKNPAPDSRTEYERAVKWFIDLHGDLPVSSIKKPQAKQFRQALQEVAKSRPKALTSFVAMVEHGRANPERPRLSAATINKLLGGVQAVTRWAHDDGGFVPDDTHWPDPFARIRLEENESEREPFDTSDLQGIFSTPVFSEGNRPRAGKGEAAFWMPLLGLYTGARRGELAALTVQNVFEVDGHWFVKFEADAEAGKRLKTKYSAREVPIHRHLVDIGFCEFVERQKRDDISPWLFPELSPAVRRGSKNWGRWFGRYVRGRTHIGGAEKVFHSFRHTWKDAARSAGILEEVHDALSGHSHGRSVGRTYGARGNIRRFGATTLVSAVNSIRYDVPALSKLQWRSR